jgi:hypothetical protein
MLLLKVLIFVCFKDFKNDLNHLNACIYIGDLDSQKECYLDLSIMDELLLKRLQISKIDDSMVRRNQKFDTNKLDLYEKREFFYLFNSFKRLIKFKNDIMKFAGDENCYNYLFELCVNMSRTIIELNDDDDMIKNLSLQFIDLLNEFFEKSADGKCLEIILPRHIRETLIVTIIWLWYLDDWMNDLGQFYSVLGIGVLFGRP